MKKRIAIVIIGLLVGLLVGFLGRGLFYYSGFYSPPPTETPSYEYIAVPETPSTEFYDEVSEEGEGIILFDLAHDNAFDKEELNVLISRLLSRGLTIEFLTEEDKLKEELLGEEEEELEEEPLDEEGDQEEEPLPEEGNQEEEPLPEEEELEEEPVPASAFVIVCPQREFSREAKETVDEFVNNGGKLLLIADPTRSGEMNSISLKFGLVFEADYLYNMKENDANFRNIFVAEFKESEITKDLKRIALYTAGSITSADGGVAFVDENTFSSMIETRKRLSPIVLVQEPKVLAVCDLTFMTEPYNGILDNNQLISNIADWLASPAEEERAEG